MPTSTASPGRVIVHSGERPILEVIGCVDRDAVCQLSGAMRGFNALGLRDLVVDVSRIRACDTRLLAALARERARITDNGGRLTIVGVDLPEFLAALDIAALDEVFVIYDAVRRGALVNS